MDTECVECLELWGCWRVSPWRAFRRAPQDSVPFAPRGDEIPLGAMLCLSLLSRVSFVGAPPTFYDLQTSVSVVAYARCLAQFRGIPGGYVGLTAADPQDGAGVSLIYRDLPLGVLVTDLRHGVSVRAQLGTHVAVV